ncbi:MAG TPA: DNA-3-methyladenine glycosylase 2 [Fimbriimonadaceae bacterium]|nr:DNA-3-methyladenine glycosylase 2 [Fimbriimonadaceae bacterium]
MTLDAEACYRALSAKDSRFDGLFFVGVQTTGIYCRCVCSAKTPQRKNCRFFSNAAAAEHAGFRPCLLCRPELAPGRARVDAVGRLASIAVRRIEDGALTDTSLADFAAELGVTDRHLRRAVVEHYGVSPLELLQTQRLLVAKRLLMDTGLPIGEVALASGFSSVRRFNALFQERYRLSPSQIRKSKKRPGETVILEIGYRAPYDWESIIRFLGARRIEGVESVRDGRYLRAVHPGGWIAVSPKPGRNALRVEVSAGLTKTIPQILRRVRRLFDTSSEPEAISEVLGDLAAGHPGLRVPGAFDGFEACVRAIVGQQISVAGARTIVGRIARRFGTPVETPFEDLTHAFPGPEAIAQASVEDIASVGIVSKRSKALIAIAQAVVERRLRLVPGADVDATIAQLCEFDGIGPWTAQYIAMRALAYPDAFPHSDLGILKALGTKNPAEALAIAERWRPWRAYAALHLWRSLS